MIYKLKGIIDTVGVDYVILDVSGVGYGVFCSGNSLRQLPAKGESISLFIETHVREDHIHLFGFATEKEKDTFNIITKVSGVGVKVALAILSVLSPSQLANAIVAQDKAAFKSVSGVGPKLASRIVTELKDKFGSIVADDSVKLAKDNNVESSGQFGAGDITDAVTALVGLGYSRSDAYNAIINVAAQNDNAPIDILIREGLKELSNG